MTVTKYLFTALVLVAGVLFYLTVSEQAVERRFHKGYRSYSLHYHQKIFDFTLQERPTPSHIDLQARLSMEVTSVDTTGADVLIKLDEIALTMQPENLPLSEALSDYYERAVKVRLRADGRFEKMEFPGKESNYSGYRQLLKQLELLYAPSKHYSREQEDGLGRYEAEYRNDQEMILRKKERYIQTKDQSTVRIYDSEAKGRYSQHKSWFDTITFHEKLRILQDGKKLLQVHTEITLDERVGTSGEVVVDEHVMARQQQEDVDIYQKLDDAATEQFFQKGGYTLEGLLESLALDPENQKSQALLEDYLRLYPEAIEKLGELFDGLNDTQARDVIAILEVLQLKESETLLREIALDESKSEMNRVRTIIALGASQRADPETISALENIILTRDDAPSKERSDTALLALGAMGRDSDEVRAVTEATIKAALRDAQNYSEAKVALLAAKNGGTKPYLEEILPYLSHQDARLRERTLKIVTPYACEYEVLAVMQQQSDVETKEELKSTIDDTIRSCE